MNESNKGYFPDSIYTTYTVAPFWVKHNARVDGQVSCEVHNNSSNSDPILHQVSLFINRKLNNDFLGKWMIIGEWRDIPESESTPKVITSFDVFLAIGIV